jgi:DNA-binding NtrC family response regulator
MGGNMPHILIIEDNKDVQRTLQLLLEDLPAAITCIRNPVQVKKMLKEQSFDLILLDMNFSSGINSGNEGLFWLREILQEDPEMIVILMTAYGSVDLAVKAIKEGAIDFVMKPWDNEKLMSTILAGLKLNQRNRALLKSESRQKEISRIGQLDRRFVRCESSKMEALYKLIAKAGPTDANILVTGENGTGKQLVASEIHNSSANATGVFLTVDLNTLAPSVFEAELFGYRKGAFTDAHEDRMGRFEAADGGTLFLDEIGNLPNNLQVKLLTVIQNKEITPLGSNTIIPLNIRLITATNIDLEEAVEAGNFREDLYFRLKTIELEVPPLRERKKDIALLANHFLQLQGKRYNRNLSFTKAALKVLNSYPWPGNVRELEHTIEKAVILSESNKISENNLQLRPRNNARSEPKTLQELEKRTIIEAIDEHNGNFVQAAATLGITRQTIYNKMKKYGI